jgi:hypothetical protein
MISYVGMAKDFMRGCETLGNFAKIIVSQSYQAFEVMHKKGFTCFKTELFNLDLFNRD